MLTYTIPDRQPSDKDELFDKAVQLVQEIGMASATLIQRQFKIGYARAARLLDELEEFGIVGPVNGAKPREILVPHKNREGETITPPPKEQPVKVEFEDTLSKWKSTKYAEDAKQNFEIEIGVDEKGNKVSVDMDKYGNLLIIGSQFTSALDLVNNILSLSMAKFSPEQLRLIAIDGIRGDLVVPNQASHLLTPLIVEPEKSISALKWSVCEIERRMKLEAKGLTSKVLVVINAFNQVSCFSPSEFEDNLYRLIASGRKYGFYFVIATDYPSPRTSKEIVANSPAKIVFKPTDKKVARETGVPESIDLTSPNEAILETMYEGKKWLNIKKIDPKSIYEEIFE